MRHQSSSLHALAGTYWNDGYGALTLCAPESTSPYCQQTLAHFATIDNVDGAPQQLKKQLVAAWSRVFSSHIRLIPRTVDARIESSNIRSAIINTGADELKNATGVIPFTMQLLDIFPEGYGADRTPFSVELALSNEAIDAEFVLGTNFMSRPEDGNNIMESGYGNDVEQLEVIGLGIRGLDFAQDRLPAQEGWDVYWRKIRSD
jgi:hypothetical protein